MTARSSKLGLDPEVVRTARDLARIAGQPIVDMARSHSTVSVERAVLRLAGLDGADDGGMPWVNRLVDAVRETSGLEHGVALPAWDALVTGGYPGLPALARDAADGKVKFRVPEGRDAAAARAAAQAALGRGFAAIDAQRARRESMIRQISDPPRPGGPPPRTGCRSCRPRREPPRPAPRPPGRRPARPGAPPGWSGPAPRTRPAPRARAGPAGRLGARWRSTGRTGSRAPGTAPARTGRPSGPVRR